MDFQNAFTMFLPSTTQLLFLLLSLPLDGMGDEISIRHKRKTDTDNLDSNPPEYTISNTKTKDESKNEGAVSLDDAATQDEVYVLESDSDKQENTFTNQEPEGASQDHDTIRIRKCCQKNEYFSFQTQQCEAAESDGVFREAVRLIMAENAGKSLEYITGTLQACPGTGDPPKISQVSLGTHSILPYGYLRDHDSATNYDHDHHCLELAANGADLLDSAVFVTALCHPWPAEVLTRKCCELHQYFDHSLGGCYEKTANMSDENSLVDEFYNHNPRVTTFHIKTERLTCDRGKPRLLNAQNSYLDAANQLCELHTDRCYPLSLYCLEYLWAPGDSAMTAVASVCPLETFHKCCPPHYVLTDAGCVVASEEHIPSLFLTQMQEIMEPMYGFPTLANGEQCGQEMVTQEDTEIRWTISRSGYLSVDTTKNTDSYETEHYCVEDYIDTENRTNIVVLMCYNELESIAPVHLSDSLTEVRSLGKCCPHGSNIRLKDNVCIPDDLGLDLTQDQVLQKINVSQLTYTSYPKCHTSKDVRSTAEVGYFHYNLVPDSDDDYAELKDDLNLDIVSLVGKCVFSRQLISRQEY